MSDESVPDLPEAFHLERDFPMSYAIFAMARVHKAIAGSMLGELGLFPNQEIMLMQLEGTDGLSQSTLATTLRVNHATVAKSVARMERAGLIERRRSTDDGRVTLVYLTPAGRELLTHIRHTWAKLDAVTTSTLTDADKRAFLAVAAKIRPALDTALAETSPSTA